MGLMEKQLIMLHLENGLMMRTIMKCTIFERNPNFSSYLVRESGDNQSPKWRDLKNEQ